MQREIKFRAWDVDRNKMINDFYFFCKAIEGNKTTYCIYEDVEDYKEGPTRNCEIMQYTGLKDKNGKEIYEGDILEGIFSIKTGERTQTHKRTKHRYSVYSDIKVSGVCEFNSGSWYFNSNFKVEYKTGFYAGCGRTISEKRANESVTTYSDASELLNKIVSKIEVIGNIYENPELLNTDKNVQECDATEAQ